jgi:glucose/arabinose dehydrogenase
MRKASLSLLLLCAAAASAESVNSTPEPGPPASHTFNPTPKQISEQQLRQMKLPRGFRLNVFAKDLGNARMLLASEHGIYVTRTADGKVTLLLDRDGDGVAEQRRDVVPNLKEVHGIAIREDQIYLATPRQLYRGKLTAAGDVQNLNKIGPELPEGGGGHSRRTLGFGPVDGLLYISVGSTCNNCIEKDPEHATMLRAQPDGTRRTIFARGLRNTIGFAWHPQTRELWGMDHGSDGRGDDLPPEELNRIVEGADYGWPFCYGNKVVDALADKPADGTSKEQHCEKSIPPVLMYQAHSAPIGMAFYTGSQFPAEFRNDAYVAMRGSWNRQPATGYKVVRIHFQNGQPVAFEDFLTGFLSADGQMQFGRLAGITVTRDGSLLVSDDANGVVYRVSYAAAP